MWRGYIRDHGYGVWGKNTPGTKEAHRRSYEMFIGPIPEGMDIHHRCFNRSCVNPEHLEAVTHIENLKMSRSVGAETCAREDSARRVKERPNYGRLDRECKNGHPRTPENTVILPSGTKRCRICRNEAHRKPGGYLDPERERATHCPHGHEWTPSNTYEYERDGRPYRYCRECNRQAARNRP